jgi:2-polyprenyl-3-methyl-5-hydroxy-6-metoxy-1,4-benzoquinol methylase
MNSNTKNAITFHSEIALQFANSYDNSYSFKKRYEIWSNLFVDYGIKGDVLDLGCGSGIFSITLAKSGCKVIGLDGSTSMIEICKSQTNPTIDATFYEETFPDVDLKKYGQFDCIISSSALEYVEELDFFLKKIEKRLKPNGLLVVSLPNKKSIIRTIERISFKLFKKPNYYSFVKNIYSKQEFSEILIRQGFKVEEIKFDGSIKLLDSYFSWLPKELTKTMIIYTARCV